MSEAPDPPVIAVAKGEEIERHLELFPSSEEPQKKRTQREVWQSLLFFVAVDTVLLLILIWLYDLG